MLILGLPLLASLAWKRLQTDTDSTPDKLSKGINTDDLEQPWTPKIRGLGVEPPQTVFSTL